jgi:hypothetical protein
MENLASRGQHTENFFIIQIIETREGLAFRIDKLSGNKKERLKGPIVFCEHFEKRGKCQDMR